MKIERRPVDIASSSMHMQKIETVDMPRSEALVGSQVTLGELKITRQDYCWNMRLLSGVSSIIFSQSAE